ncbi:NrdH-redoxin [Candidatus Woesearchaeota archaeon]|nr:NrdH-redoxin [Candidatus Woesearchaeota archaeon]
MKIVLYTFPTCKYSKLARTFFRRRQLKFEEITLFKEGEARLNLVELTGQMATPVIVIDDEIIIGFDDDRLKQIIKEKKAK